MLLSKVSKLFSSTNIMALAYCKGKKECYNLMRMVLSKINYNEYLWEICADFKVISILLGMQLGFVQYGCFVCQWRSWSKEQYKTVNWPLRDEIKAGHQNIINEPLITKDKTLLPPLHVKLGIYKNFLKAILLHFTGFLIFFLNYSQRKLKQQY